MDGISLLFLNWKRAEQLTAILEIESKYKIISEIIVFNNNPETVFKYKDPKVRVLNSSMDFGLRTRWICGALAVSHYLVFQDDDILLPEGVFSTFKLELQANPYRAYSLHGRRPNGKNEYNTKDVVGESDIVLTRATAVHKRVIPGLLDAEYSFFTERGAYPVGPSFPGEDMFLSYYLTSR